MDIKWNPSPNFTQGRGGKKIIAIVNHITAGNFPGCLSWLCNPNAKASAHYLINKQGEVYQLVREADTAWHAGGVNKPSWKLYDDTNPNKATIGIEHEGFDGTLTEVQYQATLQLHKELCAKYNIPIDRDHIIGHYQIDTVNRPNCPGPNFPWARLMKDLTAKEQVKEVKEEIKNEEPLEIYKPVNYRYLEDMPTWAQPTVKWLIENHGLYGEGVDEGGLILNLDQTALKVFVALKRLGILEGK